MATSQNLRPICVYCGEPTALARVKDANKPPEGDNFLCWLPVKHTCEESKEAMKIRNAGKLNKV